MALTYKLDLPSKCVRQRGGQNRDAIFRALSIANDECVPVEVHILHPEPESLEDAQTAAVEKACDQEVLTVEVIEHAPDLGAREDYRQALGAGGAYHVPEPGQIRIQHVFVQK